MYGLIRFGDLQWEIGFSSGIFLKSCPPFFHGGAYHYIDSYSEDLVTFDPSTARWIPKGDGVEEDVEEVEWKAEDEYYYEWERYEIYLAEDQGEIWAVFVCDAEREVSVRKWDFEGSCWRSVESLGGKCMYVSRNGSFVETCRGLENKIYMNKFFGESGVLYSVATGMYHSIEGGFASRDGYGLNFMTYGIWIKLSKS
ncbi:Unknown protein [Striga hermonthica]|uniref:KIB1-4 beta-propeller domain-containing protein n=1 Tax=Striga hermonthica TaxID=68872 RepID=A0A9N7R877_STRHE|nr:Unknown protein [Striga hermonthica]